MAGGRTRTLLLSTPYTQERGLTSLVRAVLHGFTASWLCSGFFFGPQGPVPCLGEQGR